MSIRNFCIIAHIDHGKSTLADRMLELTGTVDKRQMKDQLLDSMDLEREKGITIKLQPVRMRWPAYIEASPSAPASAPGFGGHSKASADKSAGRQGTILNLIDTPGHVDFQYEVSRSLQAVEGAVLLVDATQGVQAQTMANLYLALDQDLEIIPVINKIDLPAADVPAVREELRKLLGVGGEEILAISAKTGEGVARVLDAVVARVRPAEQEREKPLKALIFDSVYDDYKGVVVYVRVVEGKVRAQDEITFIATGVSDNAIEVGTFTPAMRKAEVLAAGDIGYIATGLKDIRGARVGDTVALAQRRTEVKALPGFAIPQPKVFAGVYPEQGDDFPRLREAVAELQLNDASLTVQAERNEALGQGFRCGFLGMLHLEIIQERLRREYELNLVVTTPSVKYVVEKTVGGRLEVHTPASWPDPSTITQIEEQYARAELIVPREYLGAVFELLQSHEGELKGQEYLGTQRVQLTYHLPLRELVVDLYDRLKSATAGFGSLSYEVVGWRPAHVVKLSILVHHEPVEALSVIVPQAKAEQVGRRMVTKLKEVVPQQLFAVSLQAAIGGRVVARETVSARRKDVTGALYGGDVTRKRKLLEKQKKGKKRLSGRASVRIPPEAYIAVLKRS